jgi:hypothetical protein
MVLTKAMSNTENPVKSTSLVQESKDQSRPTVQTWEDKSFCRSEVLGLFLQLAGHPPTYNLRMMMLEMVSRTARSFPEPATR